MPYLKSKLSSKGQAVVTLLIFMVIGVTVTTAGTILIMTSSSSTSALQEGVIARQMAESGAENAMIRLLRDPSYTGETMAIDSGTATITVSGTNPKTILSTGKNGNYIRKIQVTASDVNNILTVTSWGEIF